MGHDSQKIEIVIYFYLKSKTESLGIAKTI